MTERSLWAGIDQLKKGNRLNEVGRAVQKVAEAAGYSVVREYVGHAIGTEMHETPQVPNYWPGTPGPTLKEGMVFAIEPMVNVGAYETYVLDDGWSVMTQDGTALGALRAHDRRDRQRTGSLHRRLVLRVRAVLLALGEERRFGATLESQFREQVRHVVLDGLLGEEHRVGDLAIAEALAQEVQYPALLRAETLEADVLGDLSAQIAPSRVRSARA